MMRSISSRRATGSVPVSGSSRNSTERVVHQRLGQLDPLPHPLGIAPDRPVGMLGHPHQLERPLGRRLAHPVDPGPPAARSRSGTRGRSSTRRTRPARDKARSTGSAPGCSRGDGPAPAPRPGWAGAGRSPVARACSCPSRWGRAGRHARRQPERQVVHPDHVAVPLRDRMELDRPIRLISSCSDPWTRMFRSDGLAHLRSGSRERTLGCAGCQTESNAEAGQDRPADHVAGITEVRRGRR